MYCISTNFSFRNAVNVFLFTFLLGSCTKEVDNTLLETKTFMHVYPELGGQTCNFMKATPDGGCMLIINEDLRATGDGKKLSIMKLNEKGKLEWKRSAGDYELPSLVNCVVLADGSMLFTPDGPAGYLVKINSNGQVAFVTDYTSTFNGYKFWYGTYPVEGNDGTYKQVITNGPSTWNASAHIASFDLSGNLIGTQYISEASFDKKDFKLVWLSIYKYGNGNTNYFVGGCFMHDKNNFSWGERLKLFVAKQVYYDSALAFTKTVLVDTALDNDHYQSFFHKYTSDKHLLINTTVQDYNKINRGQLIKVNDDLDILWKTDIVASPYGSILNCGIEETRDGNYFVTGACIIPGKTSQQPFAAKVSRDGKLLWTKIFQFNLSGALTYGIENVSGDFILTGVTTGFGSGNTGADLFILKTDNALNYKQ
ncbi:MAG: hypothetical protein WC760_09470 [Bacteroidia bacterium]|jgi:hypothetical protein